MKRAAKSFGSASAAAGGKSGHEVFASGKNRDALRAVGVVRRLVEDGGRAVKIRRCDFHGCYFSLPFSGCPTVTRSAVECAVNSGAYMHCIVARPPVKTPFCWTRKEVSSTKTPLLSRSM